MTYSYPGYFISTSALREGPHYSKHIFDKLCNNHNEMRVIHIRNVINIFWVFFVIVNLKSVVSAFDFEEKPPIRGSCSANFTEPEGTFSSMNFPDNPYPALANCSWTIEVRFSTLSNRYLRDKNAKHFSYLGKSRQTHQNKYSLHEP